MGSRAFGRESNFRWNLIRLERATDDSCFAVAWMFTDIRERYGDTKLAVTGVAWDTADAVVVS
jgi:hypothetical protein